MGLDAEIWARGRWTSEQVKRAEALFHTRLEGFLWEDHLEPHDDCIVATTGNRYYGPGYERGQWPQIDAAIRIMRACFPDCTIHYCGDTMSYWPDPECGLWTEGDSQETWDWWLSDKGNAYREYMAEAFPRSAS